MNIFHEVHVDRAFSDALMTVGVVLAGVTLLLCVLGIIWDIKWRKKEQWQKTLVFIGTILFVLACGAFVSSGINYTIAANKADDKTVYSLQNWTQDNYSIKLSKDDAEALAGTNQRVKAVAVDYKDKPTVVQLIKYKNGYILVNNENQAVLPQK